MRTRCAAFLGVVFLVTTAFAATLPELLHRAKEQFKSGSYADALATLAEVETESAKPGLEKDRAALEPIVAFYRGPSYASLGRNDEARSQFAIFLKHQPNASLDAAVYSKKVIAALEHARKAAPGAHETPPPSLATAYVSFSRPAVPQAEAPGEEWADGPVRFLLSASEREEYGGLGDPSSRASFVSSFWERRDPDPATPENELRAEFEKRVSFADSRFTQGETRGSLTDRGMVFVLLGPPTYVGRKPLTATDDLSDARVLSIGTVNEAGGSRGPVSRRDPAPPGRTATDAASNWREVWHYRKEKLPAGVPYLQVDFEFITKRGYGENVLQRDAPTLDTLERARAGATPGPG